MGHTAAHFPHAMHLKATLEPSGFRVRWNGQASTHSPQPLQSFLFTIYTPCLFWMMALFGHASAHFPHWTQVTGRVFVGSCLVGTIFKAAKSGLFTLKYDSAHSITQARQFMQSMPLFTFSFFIRFFSSCKHTQQTTRTFYPVF